jgi:hypothetical protein
LARIRTTSERIYEKIPPLLGYLIFIFIILSSIFEPFVAAVAILSVNVYFFYKSIAYLVQFAIGLVRIKNAEQLDWFQKLKGLEDVETEAKNLTAELEEIKKIKYSDLKNITSQDHKYFKISQRSRFFRRFFFYFSKRKTINFLKREIKTLKEFKGKKLISYKELRHIIIIPHVKEPLSILRDSVECIKNQSFPTNQIVVVLAAEAADPNGVKVSEELKKEFEGSFFDIWITNHVLGEDEAVGKSANMAWAGKEAARRASELGWDSKTTTITSCDADSKFDPSYFSYMSYKYLTTEDAEYKYYTGAMIFYNNIWRLKFYARVKNSMSSIYNVGRLVRTDKLVPFSTYTSSLWMIQEIGFWTPWVTPEDFHMFFKALLKFDSKVETIPLFLKTMSDAAEGETHWETIVNNYKQSRRWSWGISDDGWVLQNMFKNWNKYSIRSKYIALHTIFDHVTGPVVGILILVGGNIPPLLNDSFNRINLGANLPYISSTVIRLTAVFMILVVILDFFLKPKRKDNSIIKVLLSLLEWPFLTIASFFLTILPGIEAHTRLLFGKYLEYYVTVKKGDKEEKTID